jgi:hypothetical protein
MRPVVAPAGTVVSIRVLETSRKSASAPLNHTPVAPSKSVPVIVTFMPTSPVAGSKEVMVGAGTVTVKSSELRPVPPGVVTSIRPVFAPAGTVVSIRVLDTVVKLAEVPSNRTLVAPSKFVPVSVTEVPTGPRFGAQDTMVGAGTNVKSLALVSVPPGVVTLILPVVDPTGTDVLI